MPPPEALIVKEYVPGIAFRLGEIVSFDVPEPLTDDGLNDELVRFGTPLILKPTEEENDPNAVTVTVYEVVELR